MSNWNIVRFDPAYEEPLDPEIIPLCDALNAAGFSTNASCCGHGDAPPRVWFDHSSDERIESLARFTLAREKGDYRPFYSRWQKEILLDEYCWCLTVQPNNVYQTTPRSEYLIAALSALEEVTAAVNAWVLSGQMIKGDSHGSHRNTAD